MKVYYFKEDIRNVTEYYYNIMLSALKKNQVQIVEKEKATLKEAWKISRNNYILLTSLTAFIKFWLLGRRNVIYWYQGITPEEDRMINGSSFRFLIFSLIEKISLMTVKYKIGVSKYLFQHFEKKYHVKIPLDTVFIMPCFNSDFHKESFYVEGKYQRNVFCYAGGMQVWQGFEEIVKLYSAIEKKYSNSFLKVYSKDKDAAKVIIDQYELKNYSLDTVPQEEIERALSDCKFGFIIREDNEINNVATPTKLGAYIGNGIIPVYTPTIYAFADLASRYKYLCCSDVEKIVDALEPYMNEDLNPDDLYKEYVTIFKDYFNKESYINKLSQYIDIKEK